MSSIFDEKGHLTFEAIHALKTGTLSEIELLQALKHIGECKLCGVRYADSFGKNELEEIPSGFAEEVLSRISTVKDSRKQYILYSLRVTVAVCASLAIIFSGALNFMTKMDYTAIVKSPDLRFVNAINTSLRDVSQKILDMEVNVNDKEEK